MLIFSAIAGPQKLQSFCNVLPIGQIAYSRCGAFLLLCSKSAFVSEWRTKCSPRRVSSLCSSALSVGRRKIAMACERSHRRNVYRRALKSHSFATAQQRCYVRARSLPSLCREQAHAARVRVRAPVPRALDLNHGANAPQRSQRALSPSHFCLCAVLFSDTSARLFSLTTMNLVNEMLLGLSRLERRVKCARLIALFQQRLCANSFFALLFVNAAPQRAIFRTRSMRKGCVRDLKRSPLGNEQAARARSMTRRREMPKKVLPQT